MDSEKQRPCCFSPSPVSQQILQKCHTKTAGVSLLNNLTNTENFTLSRLKLVSLPTMSFRCPHLRKSSPALQNYTISELPLNLTLTREGSNTLAAKRTQRNASPDHTHLYPLLNTQHTASVFTQSLQKDLQLSSAT